VPVPRPADAQLEMRWIQHASALRPVSHWDLRGRLAVRTDSRGGQASLAWRREANRHSIQLNGPFGSGAVRVTQDSQGARLQDAENRVFEAANAEQLVALYTGWNLPIANLDWWLRGLPVPEQPLSRELDDAGRLRLLHQQGWTVQYQEYKRVEEFDLPSRLTLTRAAEGVLPGMEARFVIERWGQVK
jgi:outer membrane lipoprotein LolB